MFFDVSSGWAVDKRGGVEQVRSVCGQPSDRLWRGPDKTRGVLGGSDLAVPNDWHFSGRTKHSQYLFITAHIERNHPVDVTLAKCSNGSSLKKFDFVFSFIYAMLFKGYR